MSTTKGKNLKLYIQADGKNYVIAASRECSIKRTHSPIETVPQQNWQDREYAAGKTDWEVTVSGLVVGGVIAGKYNPLTLLENIGSRYKLEVEQPAQQILTKRFLEGYAYITSFVQNRPNGKLVTYQATFKGTGPLTPVNIPLNDTSKEPSSDDIPEPPTAGEEDITLTSTASVAAIRTKAASQ